MKKWLASALALMMTMTVFAGCGDEGDSTKKPSNDSAHVCSFTLKNTDAKYLKKAASELSHAQYYYSCECGAMGKDFFQDGFIVEVEEGYTRYDVYSTPLDNKTVGYGAQIDTDNFMPWNNLTAEEENMLKQRIADMNLQYTRIKFFPEYYERGNDNDDPDSFDVMSQDVDFNSVEMQALYKVLDICEENHINVDLSWYGCKTEYQSYDGKYTNGTWLGYPDSANWVTAPRKEVNFDGYAEYAENISVLLSYLINNKGYTCIYGISVIEEMFYDETDTRDYDEYIKCCEVIDARLKKDGLRDKVQWIGQTTQSTAADGPSRYFNEELQKNKHVFDICGMPNYRWENASSMSGALTYFKEVMEYASAANKGLIITEFCQGGHFLDAVNKTDIDDYTAGMYLSRFMIAAADNGVAGLNHYILGDTYFNNSYVHTMGLWGYRDNRVFTGNAEDGSMQYETPANAADLVPWAAHPEYYFWGLICKYTDIGSEIYRIREAGSTSLDEDFMLISFRLPDGSWSYIIANNTAESRKIAIVNDSVNRPQSLQKYVITEAGMPTDRAVVLPSSSGVLQTGEGAAYVEVPAMSLTVLSNKA